MAGDEVRVTRRRAYTPQSCPCDVLTHQGGSVGVDYHRAQLLAYWCTVFSGSKLEATLNHQSLGNYLRKECIITSQSGQVPKAERVFLQKRTQDNFPEL